MEWLTAAGASVGAGIAAFLAGRKSSPVAPPVEARQTIVPAAPDRLAVVEAELARLRSEKSEAELEAMEQGARRALTKAIRAMAQDISDAKKKPKEADDGPRTTDPDTKP